MVPQGSEEPVQDEKTGSAQDKKVSIDKEAELKEANVPEIHRHLKIQLDSGNEHANSRQNWWQFWLPKDPPPPAPPSLEDAAVTPLANASIFSQLTYTWATSLMVLGYQRTLQASDLYKMDTSRESAVLAAKLEAAWQRRVNAAADWNVRLESGELMPSLLKYTGWTLRAISSKGKMQGATWSERRVAFYKHWRESEGRKEASLMWALNDVFRSMFWVGGVFKVIGDMAQLMSPVVLQKIIVFAEERSAAIAAGKPVPNVGPGIAMALGLFLLSVTQSVCTHQFFWRSMATGLLTRAALITCIYERGVNLTGKARIKLNNAALVNHISTDVSRIDSAAQWFHSAWTSPIQVIVCLIILLTELGPSALVGCSLFIIVIPIQGRLMTLQRRMRLGSMKWTDQRAKVLLEVLGAIRVVKYFSYEVPFLQKIFELRKNELRGIRRMLHSTSANLAVALSLPVLAATLAFVTYTLTTHDFNIAAVFASLSLFQLLRQPMLYMPTALAAIPDASSAIQRLTHIFHAELISEDALVIAEDQELALVVKDATFEWESFEKDPGETFSSKKGGGKDKTVTKDNEAKEKSAPEKDAPLFRVKNVTMTIPRGQLVAVVGPVGSGKSSLLQGLIGEMRKVSGHVSFGGRIGYCPQTAWIQNATLRDNITFGKPFEEDRYWRIVEIACLLPDLQLLPDGDLTEIGEKGINLSGGQKQRVNIARALYFDPAIVIFDDPLSAVDAHVGKSLFQDAIVGALRNRGVTVILVTHAIHFLSQVDHIYTLNNGVITESGTYDELISRGGDFAHLDLEFGGHASEGKDKDRAEEVAPQTGVAIEDVKSQLDLESGGHASEGKDKDQAEEVAPQTGVAIEVVKSQLDLELGGHASEGKDKDQAEEVDSGHASEGKDKDQAEEVAPGHTSEGKDKDQAEEVVPGPASEGKDNQAEEVVPGHASEGKDKDQAEEVVPGPASEGKDNQAEEVAPQTGVAIEVVKLKSESAREKATGSGKLEGRLMAQEKRTTGSVSWRVYWTYLVAGRGSITGPLVLFFIIVMQGSQILNSYTLVWWESNKFDRPNSFYQTLYGCLGVSQAVFTFLLGVGMDFVASYVSRNLYQKSVRNVFYAPMSFFDTTPTGRILSIFGKDIDSVDNQLGHAMRMVVLSLSSVVGSIVIVTILEPYFLIAVFFIAIGYGYFAAFYRASAREIKRIDAMLRSILYAHFSETLTGLPTIRSYGEMRRFIDANRYYVDLEDRALYLVLTNQRWLAVRLDFMGGVLVFFVALLAVTNVSGINAAQIGLVLTYTITLSLMCGLVIRQTADVENHMNAVERLAEYVDSNTIPQEAPHEIEAHKPPAQWPQHGAVEFTDVKMAYRPGLPDVLRGISVKVEGGEKIGVVGRTGAGKSSLMLTLFRIVELSGGSITIDGIDISTIGLKDLRSKISIIPQDPLLFSGTIRSNLDPSSQHSDAELWDALHRSCLVDSSTTSKDTPRSDDIVNEQTNANRRNLDSTIESEGANLSVGERSLLSLARALVKGSKVVVLDEATASVDLETDSKIQQTIQSEFKGRTLLCIAHRLRTVISYDRILVLDAGLVSEFDTPSNLFKMEDGVFRGMCDRSNISLKDIETSNLK